MRTMIEIMKCIIHKEACVSIVNGAELLQMYVWLKLSSTKFFIFEYIPCDDFSLYKILLSNGNQSSLCTFNRLHSLFLEFPIRTHLHSFKKEPNPLTAKDTSLEYIMTSRSLWFITYRIPRLLESVYYYVKANVKHNVWFRCRVRSCGCQSVE